MTSVDSHVLCCQPILSLLPLYTHQLVPPAPIPFDDDDDNNNNNNNGISKLFP